MNLRELLYREGVISDVNQTSVCCPFHGDRHPSATLFTNTMRCWSKCHKMYYLDDFMLLYGVNAIGLTKAPEPLPDPEEEANEKVVMFIGPEN